MGVSAAVLDLDLNERIRIRLRLLGSDGLGWTQEPARQFAEIGHSLHQRQQGSHDFSVKDEAPRDEHGMRNRRTTTTTNPDFIRTPANVQPPHALHFFRVEDILQFGFTNVADRFAVEHVALAAGVDVAVVLHVHRAAP